MTKAKRQRNYKLIYKKQVESHVIYQTSLLRYCTIVLQAMFNVGVQQSAWSIQPIILQSAFGENVLARVQVKLLCFSHFPSV